jgi:hypothetical protein
MVQRGRFDGPADVVSLKGLLRENRRVSVVSAVGAVVLAFLVGYVWLTGPDVEKAPLVAVEFVLRKPRMTKQFELRKARVQKRELTRRQAAPREAKVLRTVTEHTAAANVLGSVASYTSTAEGGATVGEAVLMPPVQPLVRLPSSKEPEKRISMQEELLDLQALDTGKYKGLVIQDPTNKQAVSGFIYLALAVGSELDPPTPRAIPQLARAINDYTSIDAKVDLRLPLDSRDLLKAPFVYITEAKGFSLTEYEARNLATYLRSGGFVFAENSTPQMEYGPAESSLRKMFSDVLGKEARFQVIPDDHLVYSCFFEFDNGPPTGGEIRGGKFAAPAPYLEGIYLDGRLAVVYSDKGYGLIWEQDFNNEAQLKMGVNLVVYALTQTGSIAQQQIDFYSQR